MEKFERLTGVAVPLMGENVNTDAIMPTAWIVNVADDWGAGLFGNWRRDLEGRERPDFLLNQPRYRESRILLAGRNFGCGSSREEAVWGLVGFGIRCVIAPSFSDIFYDNAFKNGLLPVVLSDVDVTALANELAVAEPPTLTVDLVRCVVTAPDSREFPFCLDNGRRADLLQGLDDIGRTLTQAATIDRFQATDHGRRPWVYTRAG